jgi:hypothetical protein
MNEPRVKNVDLFLMCLSEAASNKELLAEFDRLTGYNISLSGPAIVQEIDKATGQLEAGAKVFYEFVMEKIYLPVQAKMDESEKKQ